MQLHYIMLQNPSALFNQIHASKSTKSIKLHSLTVGEKSYNGDCVPDGFYASLNTLKCPDMNSIYSSPEYESTLADYEYII